MAHLSIFVLFLKCGEGSSEIFASGAEEEET